MPKVTGCLLNTRVETRAPHGTVFQVTYSVTDAAGNKVGGVNSNLTRTLGLTRVIEIKDTTPPIIEVPDEPFLAERNVPYVPAGFPRSSTSGFATDNVDDNPWLSEQIRANDTSGIDTSAPAFTRYYIEYTLLDAAGVLAEPKYRTIIIADSTRPTIGQSSSGLGPETFEVGKDFSADQFTTDGNRIATGDTADGPYAFGPLLHASRVRTVTTLDQLESCADSTKFVSRACPTCYGQCRNYTLCSENEFEVQPPTDVSDRQCQQLTPDCEHGELEIPGSPFSFDASGSGWSRDRVCCNCADCTLIPALKRKLPESHKTLAACRPIVDLRKLDSNAGQQALELPELVEDIESRRNSGTTVKKMLDGGRAPFPTVTYANSIAVVGNDNRFGAWGFRCCASVCPFIKLFSPFDSEDAPASDEHATLLKGECEIRFQPADDFNTESDAGTGKAFDPENTPSLTFRAWRRAPAAECTESPCAGDYGLVFNLTEAGGVASPTSLFGAETATVTISVRNEKDGSSIVVNSAGADLPLDTVFKAGSAPIEVLDASVRSFLSSPEIPVKDVEVILSVVGEDASVDPQERLLFSAAGAQEVEVIPVVNDGKLTYSFRSLSAVTPFGDFNKILGSFRYVHQNTTLREFRDREVRFVVNGERDTAIFTTIVLRQSEPPPEVDLDPNLDDVNSWSQCKADPADGKDRCVNQVLLPKIRISAPARSGVLTRATVRIEDPLPGDSLTFRSIGGEIKSPNLQPDGETTKLSNGELRFEGEARSDVWQQLLKSVQYTGQSPKRITVVVSNGFSDSLPAIVSLYSIHTIKSKPWVDLNGDAHGVNSDGAGANFVEGQAGASPLFPDARSKAALSIYDPDTLSLARVEIRILNAADCPFEKVTVPQAAIEEEQLASTSGSPGSLTIFGIERRGTTLTYESILKQVQYSNSAAKPTAGPRIIEVTATDVAGLKSDPATTLLLVNSFNTPPTMLLREQPASFEVPQDVNDGANAGHTVAELIDTAVSTPYDANHVEVLRCPDSRGNPSGCNFSSAVAQCRSAALDLCEQGELEHLWKRGTDRDEFGVHMAARASKAVEPRGVLLWTAATVTSNPGINTSLANNSRRQNVELGVDAEGSFESAFAALVTPGALRPRYVVVNQRDVSVGEVELNAVCCPRQYSPKKAEAIFDVDGVRGRVLISQKSPDHAAVVSLTFTGLGNEFGAFEVRQNPLPNSIPDGFDAECTDLGEVYAGTAKEFGGSIRPGSVEVNAQNGGSTQVTKMLEAQVSFSGSFLAPPDTSKITLFGDGREKESVLGKSFVIKKGGSAICATIREPGAALSVRRSAEKNARATFAMEGYTGTIRVSQASANETARVLFRMDKTGAAENVKSIEMYEFPVPARTLALSSAAQRCEPGPGGGNFGALISVLTPSRRAGQSGSKVFAESSGAYNLVKLGSFELEADAANRPVNLYAVNSEANSEGGAVVITFANNDRVCATLRPASSLSTVEARFTTGGFGGDVILQQPNEPGAATTMVLAVSGPPGVYSWGITGGQAPCGCGPKNDGSACRGTSSPIDLDRVAGGRLVICPVAGNAECADDSATVVRRRLLNLEIPLTGRKSIAGQTLVVYKSQGVPIASASLLSVAPKTVRAEYGSKGIFGVVTMSQSSPLEDVEIDIDVNGPPELFDWHVVDGTVPLGTDGATGEAGFQCYASSRFYEERNRIYNPFGTPLCTDNVKAHDQCPAGQLRKHERARDIRSGQESLVCDADIGWRCSAQTPGWTAPLGEDERERKLQGARRRLKMSSNHVTLFGENSIVGRGLTLSVKPGSCPGDVSSCLQDRNRNKCEVVGFDGDQQRCEERRICAPLVDQSDTLELLAAIADASLSGVVRFRQPRSSPEGDTTVEVELSRIGPAYSFTDIKGALVVRDGGGSLLLTCSEGTKCELDDVPAAGLKIEAFRLNQGVGECKQPTVFPGLCQLGETISFSTACDDSDPAAGPFGGLYAGASLKAQVSEDSEVLLEFAKVGVVACHGWYLTDQCPAAVDVAPFSPTDVTFDLASTLGSLQFPARPLKSTQLFTLPRVLPIVRAAAKGFRALVIHQGGGTPRCINLREGGAVAYSDADDIGPASRRGGRGLALVGTEINGGRFELRPDNRGAWIDMAELQLSRANALFVRADSATRFRFVPEPGFAGKVTCSECTDAVQNDRPCTPCPIDRTGGRLLVAGWDGSDGRADGSRGDANPPLLRPAVSVDIDALAFTIVPMTVDPGQHDARFKITYDVRDNVGNPADQQTRNVEVVDKTRPTVSLRGEQRLTIEGGDPYVDPGATGFDFGDLDVSESVRVVDIEYKKGSILPVLPPKQAGQCSDGTDTIASAKRLLVACCAVINETEATCGGVQQQLLPFCNGILGGANGFSAAQCNASGSAAVAAVDSTTKFVDTFQKDGTEFKLFYKAIDSAGAESASVTRIVTILDTTPPSILPAPAPKFAFTGVEFTRTPGQKYTASTVCEGGFSCGAGRDNYAATSINELGCILPIDVLDGELYCKAKYQIRLLPKDNSWYPFPPVGVEYSEAQPGQTNATHTCVKRTRLARGTLPESVEENCYRLCDEQNIVYSNGLADSSGCGSDEAVLLKNLELHNPVGLSLISSSAPIGTRYLVTYEVRDLSFRKKTISVLYVVTDSTPPALTFKEEIITVPYGEFIRRQQQFVGVTAIDDGSNCGVADDDSGASDGSVVDSSRPASTSSSGSCIIIPTGFDSVNTVVPGFYDVAYTVIDGLQNKGTIKRRVLVLPNTYRPDLDSEVVTMSFRVSGFTLTEDDFNTRVVHDAFRGGVLDLLQNPDKQSAPVTYLSSSSLFNITTSKLVGASPAFEINFQTAVRCGDGNRVAKYLNVDGVADQVSNATSTAASEELEGISFTLGLGQRASFDRDKNEGCYFGDRGVFEFFGEKPGSCRNTGTDRIEDLELSSTHEDCLLKCADNPACAFVSVEQKPDINDRVTCKITRAAGITGIPFTEELFAAAELAPAVCENKYSDDACGVRNRNPSLRDEDALERKDPDYLEYVDPASNATDGFRISVCNVSALRYACCETCGSCTPGCASSETGEDDGSTDAAPARPSRQVGSGQVQVGSGQGSGAEEGGGVPARPPVRAPDRPPSLNVAEFPQLAQCLIDQDKKYSTYQITALGGSGGYRDVPSDVEKTAMKTVLSTVYWLELINIRNPPVINGTNSTVFASAATEPKLTDSAGVVAIIVISVLLLVFVVPLAMYRRHRYQELQIKLMREFAAAMGGPNDFSSGPVAVPNLPHFLKKKRPGISPAMEVYGDLGGARDDIYGDATGGGAHISETRFGQQDDDAPALPTKRNWAAGPNGRNESFKGFAGGDDDDDMYNGRNNPAPNVEGLLRESEFMHGGITRASAEHLLKQAGGLNGMFLVRTKGVQLVLSMTAHGGFEHHFLRKGGRELSHERRAARGTPCPTLGHVMKHLSADREAIAHLLTDPVPPVSVQRWAGNGVVLPGQTAPPPPVPMDPEPARPAMPTGAGYEVPLLHEDVFMHGAIGRDDAEQQITASWAQKWPVLGAAAVRAATYVLSMAARGSFRTPHAESKSAASSKLNGAPYKHAVRHPS